ncbi:hypothetical protein D7Y09_16340 [bacterium 1XD42-1]|nr:hypothetical protein D7Y09_16340 [bacterium 1XD42-1]
MAIYFRHKIGYTDKGQSADSPRKRAGLFIEEWMYGKCQTPSVKLAWSHYFKFFTISDERKRSFYEKDSKIFGAFVFL